MWYNTYYRSLLAAVQCLCMNTCLVYTIHLYCMFILCVFVCVGLYRFKNVNILFHI